MSVLGKKQVCFAILILFILTAASAGCGSAGKTPVSSSPIIKDVILATTTSTQDSGLLDVLIPAFEQKTGYKVKTIAVGSGQAIAMGEKGEADVLLTHAPDAERQVVSSGSVINRRLVMHNDFVLIGPAKDPAGIKGKPIIDSFAAIQKAQSIFISRGDKSGTDMLEKKLWKTLGVQPQGSWYQESGAGMGQTLQIANEKNGYVLTDRATYLAHKKNLNLEILVEGDAKLLNIYHVMSVNPEKFTKVNRVGAQAFNDFLMGVDAQSLIASFGKDKFGQALFFADGGKTDNDFGL